MCACEKYTCYSHRRRTSTRVACGHAAVGSPRANVSPTRPPTARADATRRTHHVDMTTRSHGDSRGEANSNASKYRGPMHGRFGPRRTYVERVRTVRAVPRVHSWLTVIHDAMFRAFHGGSDGAGAEKSFRVFPIVIYHHCNGISFYLA